jgi:hydroxymethylpyrimidine pyrophosphatase-like HAD family hydrolase
MQKMVVAVDVDGTLYDGTEVAPEAIDSLRQASADGHTLIIVTGRRWEQLADVLSCIELFDCAVCEEGGVLVDIESEMLTLLAAPVEPLLVAALRAAGIPQLDVGHVVVGAPKTWLNVVVEVRDRLRSQRTVSVNKGSVALVPPGCDKGSGLLSAVDDLNVQGMAILAIGDAANDVPMFTVATFGVGVANADETVRRSGVPLTRSAYGRGVAEALRQYLPTGFASDVH